MNEKKVKYLIVGGYAVGYYGYPRATGDIDIWVLNDLSNSRKLVEVFKEFGFNVPELSVELFTTENKITRIGNPPVRIEVMTSISGVSFEECYEKKEIAKIENIEINFISLEHLKINKKVCNRFKDLDDLENLP